MEGKTVIAIAHRLSTIARMDRLIVLDQGRIVEQGSHDQLLALRGHYERLWRHQSGGFLAPDIVPTETATESDAPDEPQPDEMRAEAMPKSGKEDVPVVTRA
jgi:ATP-binding cassette subfamily B multidrug efflux pump